MKIQTAPRHLAATHRDNCEQAHPQTKHTHTHICMHARTHAHTHTQTRAHMRAHTSTNTHTHTHTHKHTHIMLTNILREDKVTTMGGVRGRGRHEERDKHRCGEKGGRDLGTEGGGW